MNDGNAVSLAAYQRMPLYLKCLHKLSAEGKTNVSSVGLAEVSGINASVIKKDISGILSVEGKPKIGYQITDVISDIEEFLGYNNVKDAVLVGAGKLGQALLGYKGFEEYGLNIIAAFDIDDNTIGKCVDGKQILPTGKLESVINKLNIKIAVLTTPAQSAQKMADALVADGIRAIWNFTAAHVKVPSSVAIKNENMAASLAVLSNQLKEILHKEQI